MHEAGLPLAALERYQAAALADPCCAEAHAAGGEVLMELGRPAEAALAFERAAALETDRAAHWHRLAEALAASDRLPEAIAALESLLALRPGLRRTQILLAAFQEHAGDLAAAIANLREAVFASPDDAPTRRWLGRLLLASGDVPQAIAQLQKCLRGDPDDAEALFHLARAEREFGERDQAVAHLRRCLTADPDDGFGAAAELAAIEAEQPGSLTPAFVRCLFDQYAERFDGHLLETLRYRGHLLVGGMAGRLFGEASLAILDIGCGTGLAGAELRPLAHRLVGVDLSPRMVEQAMRRGIYDDIASGDMVEAMRRAPGAWDLIAAADVLAYVGDLRPVFQAAATALRPGGLFVATVEEGRGDAPELKPTRRFGHSEAHLRRVAEDAGLLLVAVERAVLRLEKRQMVAGLVFALGVRGRRSE